MTDKVGTEIGIGLIIMGIALGFGLANFGEDKITITIEHVITSPDVHKPEGTDDGN